MKKRKDEDEDEDGDGDGGMMNRITWGKKQSAKYCETAVSLPLQTKARNSP